MSTYPPDGWNVGGTGVTWAADFAQETTLVVKGANSVKFKAGSPPANDPYLYTDLIPVDPSRPYVCEFRVRADSIAVGNTITLEVFWFKSDEVKSAIDEASDIFATDELAAADTWYVLRKIVTSPSDAAYASIRMTKNNTSFNAYMDYGEIKPHKYSFYAYLDTAAQTITTSTETKIEFDEVMYNYGNVFDTTGNYFTAPVAGIYTFTSTVTTSDSLGDGDTAYMRFYRGIDTIRGNRTTVGAADTVSLNSALNIELSKGDSVQVRFWQNSGGDIDVSNDIYSTFFSGALVE